jgi:hypothetical protein
VNNRGGWSFSSSSISSYLNKVGGVFFVSLSERIVRIMRCNLYRNVSLNPPSGYGLQAGKYCSWSLFFVSLIFIVSVGGVFFVSLSERISLYSKR